MERLKLEHSQVKPLVSSISALQTFYLCAVYPASTTNVEQNSGLFAIGLCFIITRWTAFQPISNKALGNCLLLSRVLFSQLLDLLAGYINLYIPRSIHRTTSI